MFETDAELAQLDALFEAHLARANPHMLAIVTPERRLSARQVTRYLQGTKHVAFATVTSKGLPRVSPLDALFIHGRFRQNMSKKWFSWLHKPNLAHSDIARLSLDITMASL